MQSEQVHPRGLSFQSQRFVVIRRDVHHESWRAIAAKVKNLSGGPTTRQTVINAYKRLSRPKGRVRSHYDKCGRKKWKLTPQLERFLVAKLCQYRQKCVCTAATLQRVLAQERGVRLSLGYIRKVLTKNGYKWLPRSQKRKYDATLKAERLAFARKVVSLSHAQLRERLSLAMDGCILSMPPPKPIDRWNFCKHGETYVWRKPQESTSPSLAGNDEYAKQVSRSRAVPLWGGVSAGGFSVVTFHPNKKLTTEEWCSALEAGKLTDAVKALGPVRPAGPWWVLCDNEGFLKAPSSRTLYKSLKVRLWLVPKHSPDCNPVEKFWSWLRRKLRSMDLKDAVAKRPVLGKIAYRRRVRTVCASARAQQVARSCALGLKKVCKEIIQKGGEATRG